MRLSILSLGVIASFFSSLVRADTFINNTSCSGNSISVVFDKQFSLDYLQQNIFNYTGPYNFITFNNGNDESCAPLYELHAFTVYSIGTWHVGNNTMIFSNYTNRNSTASVDRYVAFLKNSSISIPDYAEMILNELQDPDTLALFQEETNYTQVETVQALATLKLLAWNITSDSNETSVVNGIQHRGLPLIALGIYALVEAVLVAGGIVAAAAIGVAINSDNHLDPFGGNSGGTSGGNSGGSVSPPPAPPSPYPDPGPVGPSGGECPMPGGPLGGINPVPPPNDGPCTLKCTDCQFSAPAAVWQTSNGGLTDLFTSERSIFTGKLEIACKPPKTLADIPISWDQKWDIWDSTKATDAKDKGSKCTYDSYDVTPYLNLALTAEIAALGEGSIEFDFSIQFDPELIDFKLPSGIVQGATRALPILKFSDITGTFREGKLKSSLRLSSGILVNAGIDKYDIGVSISPSIDITASTESGSISADTTISVPSPTASACLKVASAKASVASEIYFKSGVTSATYPVIPGVDLPGTKWSWFNQCKSTA